MIVHANERNVARACGDGVLMSKATVRLFLSLIKIKIKGYRFERVSECSSRDACVTPDIVKHEASADRASNTVCDAVPL